MSLVWDSYRSVGAVTSTGAIVHYFDEEAQSLYLKSGVVTEIVKVDEGHWKDATYESELRLSTSTSSWLSFDHPANGILYGVAVDGTSLYFLRYTYAENLSGMIKSGSWQEQVDNQVKQMSVNIKNVGPNIFASDASLFVPGSKMTLGFTMGDSDVFPMGAVFIDEIRYDKYGDVIPISGRNLVGYKLQDQTFDDVISFTGIPETAMGLVLAHAGLIPADYAIQPSNNANSYTFKFKPSDKILAGVQQILDYFQWKMLEVNGQIIIGYDAFLNLYQTNGAYTFNEGTDVFTRNTDKVSDSAYAHVFITGKHEVNGEDVDLTPVYLPVNSWKFWSLGNHKTYHAAAPDGLTQEELATYAAKVASQLQYVGITEQFTAPIRPQLLVGDIASIIYEGTTEGTDLGLITEVEHLFGDSGFFTNFSLDSGGSYTDAGDYVINSDILGLSGFNRKLRFADLIKGIGKKG